MPSPTIIGSAGHSAISEIVSQFYCEENSAYMSFRQRMWKESKEKVFSASSFGSSMRLMLSLVLLTFMGILIYNLTGSEGLAALTMTAALPIAAYLNYKRDGADRIARFSELMGSPESPVEFPRDEIESRVIKEISRLSSGKLYEDSWLMKRARSWTLGALGELLTADILLDLPEDTTIAHDLMILNEDGSTRANVDHVVFSDRFSIMLDTKWWSTAPQVSRLPTGGFRVDSPHHAKAIKTCIWEATESNLSPELIIIAVGRTGGERIDRYDGGVLPVEEYVDDYSSEVVSVDSTPVIFLHQQRISDFILQLKETPSFWVTHATQPRDILSPENRVLPSVDPRVDLIQGTAEDWEGRSKIGTSAS